MRYLLAPVTIFYDFALQPIPALAWLGAPLSALDVAGALRLAVVLRQQRELYREQHNAKMAAANQGTKAGGKSSGKAQRVAAIDPPEPRSRVRDFLATLVIAHGGEAIAGASDDFHYLLTRSNLTFLWSRSCFHPLVMVLRSTLARPATFILPVQHRPHVKPMRTSARRPIACCPRSLPVHRASPDHNPLPLSYDLVMQCDP
jgi:hypothetical protein